MAGIYIHIPFCKQACNYCDFHFSTSLKKKEEMLYAICNELVLRKNEINENIETIYFGGGTPSLLSIEEIEHVLKTIYDNYSVIENPEITIEANPDDLSKEKILNLGNSKINRLSIGIQSFYDEYLLLMNRSHNATEAFECLKIATQYFENISIDLIYGIPNLSTEKWLKSVKKIIDLKIPHISTYALTVEEKTALHHMIKNGKIPKLNDNLAHQHFLAMIKLLSENEYVHYEISNFSKKGFESKNNSNYWLGKKYLGIGPSAHSFDGENRSWNIANNSLYIKKIKENNLPSEKEKLSIADRYNEYIMTGLRTHWGVNLNLIRIKFGKKFYDYLLKQMQKHINNQSLTIENNHLKTTLQGKFLSDGISADLFWV